MTRPESLRLTLVAGEASGDVLGADLARALKQQHDDIELAGITGPKMRAAGVTSWFDIEALSVMGLTEVLRHLPRLIRLRKALRQRVLEWPADALITIDAPDFNLGLARQLHQRDMTTIHYVSPSVWAWRSGRIPKIARSLDQLLTLFPFEPALYHPFGLDARFVGHPLADELAGGPDRSAAREQLQIHSESPVIAFLPGSRDGELKRHMDLLAETAVTLRKDYPTADLVLLLTGERHRKLALELAGTRLDRAGVRLLTGATRTGLEAADVAVAASGTVTLETFLLECPMVVFYKLAPTTFHLARSLKLVRSEFVALPNILSGESLAPERLQQEATPVRLAADVKAWLSDQARIEDYRRQARQWRGRLAQQAGHQAASAILERVYGKAA
ncbi:MAG: lipid-A-disaccharide synthase [Wenzhouxiangella sp.]|jgi:lipid-A-disaccharide synthase|nr:lipid-A-disaccharide synthase [Wenzhouxiangella sp.]